MTQTPEQRKRNAKFVKAQDASRGKPESASLLKKDKKEKKAFKSPVSPMWIGILGFVVCGGLIFELLSRFFM